MIYKLPVIQSETFKRLWGSYLRTCGRLQVITTVFLDSMKHDRSTAAGFYKGPPAYLLNTSVSCPVCRAAI